MNNYEFTKRVSESISAAQRYIDQKEACRDRHEAYIIVSVNGKDYHGVRTVFVDIMSKNAAVIIEDLHSIYSLHTNTFTAEKDIFIFKGNETLQVRTETFLCGEAVIEITPK